MSDDPKLRLQYLRETGQTAEAQKYEQYLRETGQGGDAQPVASPASERGFNTPAKVRGFNFAKDNMTRDFEGDQITSVGPLGAALQGATFNTSPKIIAALKSLYSPASAGAPFAESYAKNLAAQRNANTQYATAHPVASTVAGLAGGAIPLVATAGLGPVAALASKGILGAMGLGAAYGGAYGLGGSDEGNRVSSTLGGAALGAAGGALGGAAGRSALVAGPLLGAGLGAAVAPEGERWKGAGLGAAAGLAGGAAYRAGGDKVLSNLALRGGNALADRAASVKVPVLGRGADALKNLAYSIGPRGRAMTTAAGEFSDPQAAIGKLQASPGKPLTAADVDEGAFGIAKNIRQGGGKSAQQAADFFKGRAEGARGRIIGDLENATGVQSSPEIGADLHTGARSEVAAQAARENARNIAETATSRDNASVAAVKAQNAGAVADEAPGEIRQALKGAMDVPDETPHARYAKLQTDLRTFGKHAFGEANASGTGDIQNPAVDALLADPAGQKVLQEAARIHTREYGSVPTRTVAGGQGGDLTPEMQQILTDIKLSRNYKPGDAVKLEKKMRAGMAPTGETKTVADLSMAHQMLQTFRRADKQNQLARQNPNIPPGILSSNEVRTLRPMVDQMDASLREQFPKFADAMTGYEQRAGNMEALRTGLDIGKFRENAGGSPRQMQQSLDALDQKVAAMSPERRAEWRIGAQNAIRAQVDATGGSAQQIAKALLGSDEQARRFGLAFAGKEVAPQIEGIAAKAAEAQSLAKSLGKNSASRLTDQQQARIAATFPDIIPAGSASGPAGKALAAWERGYSAMKNPGDTELAKLAADVQRMSPQEQALVKRGLQQAHFDAANTITANADASTFPVTRKAFGDAPSRDNMRSMMFKSPDAEHTFAGNLDAERLMAERTARLGGSDTHQNRATASRLAQASGSIAPTVRKLVSLHPVRRFLSGAADAADAGVKQDVAQELLPMTTSTGNDAIKMLQMIASKSKRSANPFAALPATQVGRKKSKRSANPFAALPATQVERNP